MTVTASAPAATSRPSAPARSAAAAPGTAWASAAGGAGSSRQKNRSSERKVDMPAILAAQPCSHYIRRRVGTTHPAAILRRDPSAEEGAADTTRDTARTMLPPHQFPPIPP